MNIARAHTARRDTIAVLVAALVAAGALAVAAAKAGADQKTTVQSVSEIIIDRINRAEGTAQGGEVVGD